jgi:hypothetical protein
MLEKPPDCSVPASADANTALLAAVTSEQSLPQGASIE